jgi:hypothetical protein
MILKDYQDPTSCPFERPAIDKMCEDTRNLHTQIDAFAKQHGQRWLHPNSPTLTQDLLGGRQMQDWQERKGAMSMLGEDCWSTQTDLSGLQIRKCKSRRGHRLRHASHRHHHGYAP